METTAAAAETKRVVVDGFDVTRTAAAFERFRAQQDRIDVVTNQAELDALLVEMEREAGLVVDAMLLDLPHVRPCDRESILFDLRHGGLWVRSVLAGVAS